MLFLYTASTILTILKSSNLRETPIGFLISFMAFTPINIYPGAAAIDMPF